MPQEQSGISLNDVQKRTEEDKNAQLEAAGIREPFNSWREALPDERIPDPVVLDTFMNAQEEENVAIGELLGGATGGPQTPPAMDVPAPGPGDEGPGTGEPGAVSEGAPEGGEDDGEEEIEGLWKAPPEAEATNYVEPTTKETIESDEWLENARIVYAKFAKEALPGWLEMEDDSSDEYIRKWAKDQIGGFNWNLLVTQDWARKILTAEDPKVALAFLNLLNMYDHSDGGGKEFGMALAYLATDPTSYLGLGVGTLASKGAAKMLAKTALKKAATLSIGGGVAAGIEGGAITTGYDYARQKIEVEAEAKEKVDPWQLLKMGALGVGFGGILGGGLGYAAGKWADKIAAAVKKRAADAIGDTPFKDIPHENLVGDIRDRLRVLDLMGERDEEAIEAMKIMFDLDFDLPRTRDGRIDIDSLRRLIGEKKTAAQIRNSAFVQDIVEQGDDYVIFPKAAAFVIDVADEMNLKFDDVIDSPDEMVVWIKDSARMDMFLDKLGLRRRALDATVPPRQPESPWVQARESQELAELIAKMDDLQNVPIEAKSPGARGTQVVTKSTAKVGERGADPKGIKWEVVGKTKNGWYRLQSRATGKTINARRQDFEVTERAIPEMAGVMELSPFTDRAAIVMKLADEVAERPLSAKKMSEKEVLKQIELLKTMGVDITEKELYTYWDQTTMRWLRDEFNAMSVELARLIKRNMVKIEKTTMGRIKNMYALSDEELAIFNNAHVKYAAVRDLFYGVSRNAAQKLRQLQTRPTETGYDFTQSVLDSISLQGGRENTVRAINTLHSFMRREGDDIANLNKGSKKLFGERVGRWIMNIRYNNMLFSWRTHAKNMFGNTSTGVYEHLVISPMNMAIGNAWYAARLAAAFVGAAPTPDKATRPYPAYFAKDPDTGKMRMEGMWVSEVASSFDSINSSLVTAKEILYGQAIGHGKIANEIGLRYDVINVPQSAFGKAGTSAVRALEAMDALYKNQYYNAKLYSLASKRAYMEMVDAGKGHKYYRERWLEHIDNPTATMEKEAREHAAKTTFTNDPNVYGPFFSGLARSMQSLQSSHWVWNYLMPFVRTPANLFGWAIEFTGLTHLPIFAKPREIMLRGTAEERIDLTNRLMVATGVWMTVASLWEKGAITGEGPQNPDVNKVWREAGWEPTSFRGQITQDQYLDYSDMQPIALSVNVMASIMDMISLMPEGDTQDGTSMMIVGIGTIADLIKDETYLSTLTDFIVAFDGEKAERGESIIVSSALSFVIPNFLRDIRRVKDPAIRSLSSDDIWMRLRKQFMNAIPGLSEDVPYKYDWKGDIMNQHQNAYVRGMIPFNVKDFSHQDLASMHIAANLIPVTRPDRKIDMKGEGNFIDLMAMDGGWGYVYAKYESIVGKARSEVVNNVINDPRYAELVEDGNIGPGSDVDLILRNAIAAGSKIGRVRMLEFLIDHYDEPTFKRPAGDTVIIHHPFSVDRYRELIQQIHLDDEIRTPEQREDEPQYILRQRGRMPPWFEPRIPE